MPKLEKAERRDRKADKRRNGMRVSGSSVKLLYKLSTGGAK